MQQEFDVANVKCGGCAETIRNGLSALAGVDSVSVDIESGHVTVTGESPDRGQVAGKLAELGYPERGQ